MLQTRECGGNMQKKLLLVVAGLACACGTDSSGDVSTDYGANFAGIWSGTLTETDSSGNVLGIVQQEANIEETSRNYLKIYNACVSFSGPTVMATSATEFSSVGTYTCPPEVNGDCGSVVVTWVSITGSLNGTVLQFTANLSAALCGTTEPFVDTFTNAVRRPN
jgi:hypothetical protein